MVINDDPDKMQAINEAADAEGPQWWVLWRSDDMSIWVWRRQHSAETEEVGKRVENLTLVERFYGTWTKARKCFDTVMDLDRKTSAT